MLKRDFARFSDCLQEGSCHRLSEAAPLPEVPITSIENFMARTLGIFLCYRRIPLTRYRTGISAIEFLASSSILMTHVSRLSEEIDTLEFSGVRASSNYPTPFQTGSSIMPQKKNPDMAELGRGAAGKGFWKPRKPSRRDERPSPRLQ